MSKDNPTAPKKTYSAKTIQALHILRNTSYVNRMKAASFAWFMWPDSYMHKKVSNQGHGATRGKAAWLCGGSYLGRLRKEGLVDWHGSAYFITSKGLQVLKENTHE